MNLNKLGDILEMKSQRFQRVLCGSCKIKIFSDKYLFIFSDIYLDELMFYDITTFYKCKIKKYNLKILKIIRKIKVLSFFLLFYLSNHVVK